MTMNVSIEHTIAGQQFVHVSRSGRRYVGTTPEEAERKLLIASLHAAERELGIVHEICAQRFLGIHSLADLNLQQLRELNKVISDARRFGTQAANKNNSLEPKATSAQIKRIVKLGRYSIICEKYGKEWFWRKAKEWVVRLKDAQRVNLDELTNQEAWCLIRRLEKVEKRLLAGSSDEE
jgi:hypothetical protein